MNRACLHKNTNIDENNSMRVPSGLNKTNFLRMKKNTFLKLIVYVLSCFLIYSCKYTSNSPVTIGDKVQFTFSGPKKNVTGIMSIGKDKKQIAWLSDTLRYSVINEVTGEVSLPLQRDLLKNEGKLTISQ